MKVNRFPGVAFVVIGFFLVPEVSTASTLGHDDIQVSLSTVNPTCSVPPCTQTIGLSFDFKLDPRFFPTMVLDFTNIQFSGGGPLGLLSPGPFLTDFTGPTSTFGEMFLGNGAGDEIEFRFSAQGTTSNIDMFFLSLGLFFSCQTSACVADYSLFGRPCLGIINCADNAKFVGTFSQTVTGLPEPPSIFMIAIGFVSLLTVCRLPLRN
jgi:hypothetical protein